MEVKCIAVFLALLGLASSFAIPEDKDVKFPSTYTEPEKSQQLPSTSYTVPAPEGDDQVVRNKRHLLFKKWKKGKDDAVIINREYEHGYSGVDYRPGREVHHVHHYGPPPPYTETRWEQPPPREYHHYPGYNNEGGYYSNNQGYYGYGGAYSNNNGGYAQQTPSPHQSGPVSAGAAPAATGHNQVDRGQGAAAVNNIAIIHARASTSSHSHNGNNGLESSEASKTLPRPLPIDFDALSRDALGLD